MLLEHDSNPHFSKSRIKHDPQTHTPLDTHTQQIHSPPCIKHVTIQKLGQLVLDEGGLDLRLVWYSRGRHAAFIVTAQAQESHRLKALLASLGQSLLTHQARTPCGEITLRELTHMQLHIKMRCGKMQSH